MASKLVVLALTILVAHLMIQVVSACTDSSSSCGAWRLNNFCNNTAYTLAQRVQYCANTCGYCSLVGK